MMFTSTSDIPISKNECIGYSMLNKGVQGQIILDEATADPMYDFIVDMGGPDLRKLPFSMAALDALPEILQPVVLNKIAMVHSQEAKALEVSMMKELVASDTGQQLIENLKRDIILSGIKFNRFHELTELSEFLIERGWINSF